MTTKGFIPITAWEAFNSAKMHNDEIVFGLKKNINERIRAAADNGKFDVSISCDGDFSAMNNEHIFDIILNYLQQHGFSVIATDNYKTTVLKIEWNNVDNPNNSTKINYDCINCI